MRLWRPGRGWLIAAVCSLVGALVLAAGVAGWWLAGSVIAGSQQGEPTRAPTTAATMATALQMPDVRGLDQATAQQVLADSGIPVAAVKTHRAPSVARPGVVVEQSPAFGATDVSAVDLGVAVAVTMPALAGKTQDEAVQTLSGYGVGVDITYAYSKDAKVGTVLSGKPAVGAHLGQTASIVVATAGSTLPLTQLRSISGGCGSDSNVAIDGKDYATALSCSASTDGPSDTTFMLSKTVDRFTATVGVADDATPGAKVPYAVLADGRVIARGSASYGASSAIDVPTSGVIQLTVRVGPASTDGIDLEFGDAVVYGSSQGIARLAKLR